MKKQIILMSILILQLSLISLISAENGIEIRIQNQTISVRGYAVDPMYGKVDLGIFQKINEPINQFLSCNNFTIANVTYQNNCVLNISYSKDIQLYTPNQSSNPIIGDSALYNQLIDCERLKQQFNAGLNSCVADKATLKDVNQNYSQCNIDIQICRSDKANLETKVNDLKKEIEDKKNRQWWFFAIGLIIGGLVIAYKANMIGGPKTKSAGEKYNQGQAA